MPHNWPHDDDPDPVVAGLCVGSFAFVTLWVIISQEIVALTRFPYPTLLALEFTAIGLAHYWIARTLWYRWRRTPDPLRRRARP